MSVWTYHGIRYLEYINHSSLFTTVYTVVGKTAQCAGGVISPSTWGRSSGVQSRITRTYSSTTVDWRICASEICQAMHKNTCYERQCAHIISHLHLKILGFWPHSSVKNVSKRPPKTFDLTRMSIWLDAFVPFQFCYFSTSLLFGTWTFPAR